MDARGASHHSSHREPVFDALVRKALKRTRERWRAHLQISLRLALYFLLVFLIYVFVTLAFRMVGPSANHIAWSLLFLVEVVASFVLISTIIVLAVITPLMQYNVLIKPTVPQLYENFLYCRPIFRKYLKYQLLLFLLTIAFVPIDIILRAATGVSVLNMLISFWGVFSTIIVIEASLNGLDNFWMSRAIINHGWFKNIFRLVGATIVIIGPAVAVFLALMLIAAIAPTPYWLQITYSAVGLLAAIVYGYYCQIFMQSFTYELYEALPHPETYWKPKVLHLIAAIGVSWIIVGVLVSMYHGQSKLGRDDYKDSQINMRRYMDGRQMRPAKAPSGPIELNQPVKSY